jgi:nucleotide-binding universal stress UspA family protein
VAVWIHVVAIMRAFADILLSLATYPDATPEHAVDWAAGFSRTCGAKTSALISVLDRQKLARYYSHGSWLMDVPALIDETIQASTQNGQRLRERFEHIAHAAGVFESVSVEHSSAFSSVEYLTQCGRLHDLTILPVPDFIGMEEDAAESVCFGTGRPVLLLPAYEGAILRSPSVKRVVVAWDYSRAASRALADALPLLRLATDVHVVTFCGEKDLPEEHALRDVSRHLQLHGIKATLDDADVGGRSIGDAMRDYLQEVKADLLVMGAFGHSRLREFVLGGATRSMFRKPPVPVFLSH